MLYKNMIKGDKPQETKDLVWDIKILDDDIFLKVNDKLLLKININEGMELFSEGASELPSDITTRHEQTINSFEDESLIIIL